MTVSVFQEPTDGVDFETIPVTSASAVGLTATKVAPTTSGTLPRLNAFITVEGGQVRYRYDGTAPDATHGHLLLTGAGAFFTGFQTLKNLQFIATGANATLQVTYEA